jgi:hypothetical protein
VVLGYQRTQQAAGSFIYNSEVSEEKMARNHETKIDEEMVCADSLMHCLKCDYGCEVIFEREDDDPPDLWLIVDGEKYAVEVTSIVTRQEYYKHCKDFEDAICSSSQYKDSINGTYILIIKGCPNIPKKSASDWQDLVRQVISFVDETHALKSTNDKCLLKDKKGYLNIRKISDQYAMIGAIGPIQVKWENEIQDTLEKLIGTSVTRLWPFRPWKRVDPARRPNPQESIGEVRVDPLSS